MAKWGNESMRGCACAGAEGEQGSLAAAHTDHPVVLTRCNCHRPFWRGPPRTPPACGTTEPTWSSVVVNTWKNVEVAAAECPTE